MWERTLRDLIRGLRANKHDEAKFINQAIDEIRTEARSKDMGVKAAAILKMTFLDMLGRDLSWASFNVVEVMSSPKYHLKCVGYLAAVQSFKQDTDVLMLTNNLLKKDLSSNPADITLALNGISHFTTPDLARDFTQELNAMLNHSRAHIRKRTVLALFKIIQQYPDALPYCLPRLREKLSDPDPSVVSATVNLFCELARRKPNDFLILAPPLFDLLTSSTNNWMLIKIIKLFGSLCPHEPRLVKKLQRPITDLIQTTAAISLLYECVHTCIIGGMLDGAMGSDLARICITKLSGFLEDQDQNLKYIALLALTKIVPTHPRLVANHQAVILASVDDFDISIRMRALDLISAMVTADNAQYLVQQLLSHLVKPDANETLPSAADSLARNMEQNFSEGETASAPPPPALTPAYRLEVTNRILDMCSRDLYANVYDFEWYLSVLIDLVYIADVDIGPRIRDQLVDVVVRIKDARKYAVKLMIKLLCDDQFLSKAKEKKQCLDALWAAAFLCGEYCSELEDPIHVMLRLVDPSVADLPSNILAVYLSAALKVYGYWASVLAGKWSDQFMPVLKETVAQLRAGFQPFASSEDIEVQERAANSLQLFVLIEADLASFKPQPQVPEYLYEDDTPNVFANDSVNSTGDPRFPKSLLLVRPLHTAYELKPVGPEEQRQIKPPPGLDLDAWIVPPPKKAIPARAVDEEVTIRKKKKKGKERTITGGDEASLKKKKKSGTATPDVKKHSDALAPEEAAELERRRLERLERQRDDPYYLTDDRPRSTSRINVDSIPVVRLDMPLLSPDPSPRPASRSSSYMIPRMSPRAFEVDRGEELPPSNMAVSTSFGSGWQTPVRSYTPDIPSAEVTSPEPIVVRRSKKKGTGKKTVVADTAL